MWGNEQQRYPASLVFKVATCNVLICINLSVKPIQIIVSLEAYQNLNWSESNFDRNKKTKFYSLNINGITLNNLKQVILSLFLFNLDTQNVL